MTNKNIRYKVNRLMLGSNCKDIKDFVFEEIDGKKDHTEFLLT